MDYFDWYAAYLHRTCPVVDAHLDLVTEVYRRRLAGEKAVLYQYYKKEFQKGCVNLVFVSLFLGEKELKDCMTDGAFPNGAVLKKALDMLAAFYADLEETKGLVQLVTDRESLRQILVNRGLLGRQRVGVLLYLEGLDMLEGEPELLRCFYAMGVRGAALTWNRREGMPDIFAKGCGETAQSFESKKNDVHAGDYRDEDINIRGADGSISKSSAITGKGVQALFLMEYLGIFVDCSHLGKEAAWLLPSFTKKAYVATHSNAQALKEHERNLTEEEIKEIAERGGVIGVNACREFLTKQETKLSGMDALCSQILYLAELAGEECVGLGLDMGEGCVLDSYGELPVITAKLLRRGCSPETVKKILGGNWVRFLAKMWEV